MPSSHPRVLQGPSRRKGFTSCRRAASGRRRCFEGWRPGPAGEAAGTAADRACRGRGRPGPGAAGPGWARGATWCSSGRASCTHTGCLRCPACTPPWGSGRAPNTLCWAEDGGSAGRLSAEPSAWLLRAYRRRRTATHPQEHPRLMGIQWEPAASSIVLGALVTLTDTALGITCIYLVSLSHLKTSWTRTHL